MAPETTTLIGTLAGTFIGSALGIIGTWLTLKNQYRITSLQLSGQARLRAKELLFKTYQDRIAQINKRAGDLQGALGTFLAVYKTIDNENERKQLNEGMFALFKQVYEFRREWFNELKEERRKVGLEAASPIQMAAIENSLKMDVSTIKNQEELNQMILNIARMVAASDSLWQDVLVKRGEDLFEEELMQKENSGETG
jgi:hypothetical protein